MVSLQILSILCVQDNSNVDGTDGADDSEWSDISSEDVDARTISDEHSRPRGDSIEYSDEELALLTYCRFYPNLLHTSYAIVL
jgi:hypothetical protein